jgi:hypothetical protein
MSLAPNRLLFFLRWECALAAVGGRTVPKEMMVDDALPLEANKGDASIRCCRLGFATTGRNRRVLLEEPAAGNLHGGVCEGGDIPVGPRWT